MLLDIVLNHWLVAILFAVALFGSGLWAIAYGLDSVSKTPEFALHISPAQCRTRALLFSMAFLVCCAACALTLNAAGAFNTGFAS